MPTELEFFCEAGSGGDEEFAIQIRKDDIGFLKCADALGIGNGEGDFPAAVGLRIFLRNPDAHGVEVEGLHGGGTEFFRCDGQNPGSRPRIKRGPLHWQRRGDIAEQTQAARGRGMIAGPERHSRWHKNRALGLRVVLKRLRIGMNPQSPPDGNRGAGLLGVAGPDFLGKSCELPAEVPLQHLGGFFIPENMDREAFRAWFGEHDDALGIDRGQPEVPTLLHGLSALAGPAEYVHAAIQPGTAPLGDPTLELRFIAFSEIAEAFL